MEKETLEEAAEKFGGDTINDDIHFSFIAGAKWQAERMCNEEEVLKHLNHLMMIPSSKLDKYLDSTGMITMKWFEQFKKR